MGYSRFFVILNSKGQLQEETTMKQTLQLEIEFFISIFDLSEKITAISGHPASVKQSRMQELFC